MSLDFHHDKVERCCLVCGEFLKSQGYCCDKFKEDIANCFGLAVNSDSDWQPNKLCKCCCSKISKWKTTNGYQHTTKVMSWVQHSDEVCSVCEFYLQKCKGGARKKSSKGRGRPSGGKRAHQQSAGQYGSMNFRIPEEMKKSLFPRTAMPPIGRMLSPLSELIICPICKEVMDAPVLGPCEHAYCSPCLQTWAEHCQDNGQEVTCPECKCEFHDSTIHHPPRVLLQLIRDTRATCSRCNNIYTLDALELHECTCTRAVRVPLQTLTHAPGNVPQPKGLDEPLSHAEQHLASHLVQRKLNTEGKAVISLVTQGTVCTIFYCLLTRENIWIIYSWNS